MKKSSIQKIGLLLICLSLLTSCDNDDEHLDDGFQGETKEYELRALANSSVEGTVTFIENENASTTVEIDLEGTEDGQTYSPRLLYGTSAEQGDLAISLEDIEGDEGSSISTITKLDDDSTVSYEELTEMDGHIAIYLIGDETETRLATVDIGENEFTGKSVSYELDAVGDAGISATVEFEERVNGTTLITITSDDTEEGDSHPAYIHSGAVGEDQGDKTITLSLLKGGSSLTNVASFDEIEGEEGEDIAYEELIGYDGSIVLYLSEEDKETILSQGNIGSNSEQ